jgi:hypothetical protein
MKTTEDIQIGDGITELPQWSEERGRDGNLSAYAIAHAARYGFCRCCGKYGNANGSGITHYKSCKYYTDVDKDKL